MGGAGFADRVGSQLKGKELEWGARERECCGQDE